MVKSEPKGLLKLFFAAKQPSRLYILDELSQFTSPMMKTRVNGNFELLVSVDQVSFLFNLEFFKSIVWDSSCAMLGGAFLCQCVHTRWLEFKRRKVTLEDE